MLSNDLIDNAWRHKRSLCILQKDNAFYKKKMFSICPLIDNVSKTQAL